MYDVSGISNSSCHTHKRILSRCHAGLCCYDNMRESARAATGCYRISFISHFLFADGGGDRVRGGMGLGQRRRCRVREVVLDR